TRTCGDEDFCRGSGEEDSWQHSQTAALAHALMIHPFATSSHAAGPPGRPCKSPRSLSRLVPDDQWRFLSRLLTLIHGKPKEITMSGTKTPAETDTSVKPGREPHRHRSAKPSRRRDLRGFWRTTLALIAPLPGLLMTVKIMVCPFGVVDG